MVRASQSRSPEVPPSPHEDDEYPDQDEWADKEDHPSADVRSVGTGGEDSACTSGADAENGKR